MRAAAALGLVIALIVVPGLPPGAAPAIAQDEEQEVEPASPPSTEQPNQPPNQQPASKPSGPAPAFSPSGSGSSAGSGSGPGTGSGTGAGSGATAPSSAGAGFTPSPPPLGAVTYENPLKEEKIFKASRCFGGLGMGHYVGEGFKLRLMGRCFLLLDESEMSVEAQGVRIGDGEVALDFKVVDLAERVRIGLYVRGVNEQLIGAHLHPARGEASLFTQVEGKANDLGYRNNVVAPPYEWNTLALRVSGYNVWLLVNDEPVLHSGEVHADAGKVFLELIRDGNPDDEDEAAVVFRDLTLTALEGGDPERAPRGP